MNSVKAFEGDQCRLYATQKEAITSLLAGPSGIATQEFQEAVWGPSPQIRESAQSKRIRAAILAAAEIIKKKAKTP